MGFRINTNVISLSSQRALQSSSKALGRALERLASGSRINRAGDDAAGLAISEGLGSQVRGVKVAVRNANDALGFLNTAEGALAELTNITQRLRELAIQASNGTLGASDRTYLNAERAQLISEFDRIANQTNFNGSNLLDGSFSTTDLQVGIRKGETISFNIGDARSTNLGSLASKSGAQNAITGSTTMVINGIAIAPSLSTDDTLSSAGNSYSAIAVAKQINAKSGQSKVTADVQNAVIRGSNSPSFVGFGGTLSGDTFKINGVQITGTGITSVNAFIEAVNNVSSLSGVKARLQSGSTSAVEYYTLDGRNIDISVSGGVTQNYSASFIWALYGGTAGTAYSANVTASTGLFSGGVFGVVSAGLSVGGNTISVNDFDYTFTGAIRLRSSAAITVSASSTASSALGFTVSTTSDYTIAVDKTSTLNGISLASQGSASDALSVLDATLSSLNSLRSSLGATQSRLDSAVANLGVTLENISAARSSIRDADVATETAELTRAQILQQAGVAVLGQANTSAQAALSLLKF